MDTYEKKLALAKEALDSGSYDKETIEYIFPELKEGEESADEKIRQFLIHEVTETSDKIMSYRNMNKKDVLAWLEKQDWQKPADWSEEDEDMIRYIGNAITCEESAKYLKEKGIDIIKAHCWLDSLKPQFKLKQEWSKEDSIRLKHIIDLLRHNRKVGIDATIYQQEQDVDWLKSLMFYKQWKPSEKQINALSDVLSIRDIKYDILSELLENLKKLRKE